MTNLDTSNPVVVQRTFNAPIDVVFIAWTDAEVFKQWWGATGFTSSVAEIDARVGGRYLYSMEHPDFDPIYASGEYIEFETNRRIVFTDSFSDKDGNKVSPSVYGMGEDFPDELRVEVDFEVIDPNTTKLTLTHIGMPESEDAELTGEGWNESFDKLQKLVEVENG